MLPPPLSPEFPHVSGPVSYTHLDVYKRQEYGLSGEKDTVKKWYDGFKFGNHSDIYNPWSITNFLKEKQISPYWASTSSNGLVNRLIRTASAEIKAMMETLLEGDSVEVSIDEQLVFEQLDRCV